MNNHLSQELSNLPSTRTWSDRIQQLFASRERVIRVALISAMLVFPLTRLDAQSATDGTAEHLVLELPGNAMAKSTVEIIPAIHGVVTGVFAGVGQRVQRGDRLLTLDSSEFEITVERARIDLELAQSLLSAAESELERIQKLVERKLIAENSLGSAVLSVQLAEISVREAESDLKEAELALSSTVLRAPIDGIVSLENVAEGDWLVADEMVTFIVVDYDPIVVAAQVDQETDLMLFRGLFGKTLELERVELRLIDGTMYSHTGEHVGSSNMVDPETGNMIEYYTFPNDDLMIPVGATVTVIATYDRVQK